MTTTETPTPTPNEAPAAPASAPVEVPDLDLSLLERYRDSILSIDAQITAASGSEDAARKAVIDEMTSGHEDAIQKYVDSVKTNFGKLDGPIFIGVLQAIEDSLKSGDFKTQRDTVIDSAVKEKLANTETVDVDALKEQRKAQIGLFRSAKQILESIGFKTDTVEEPRRSGGGRPAGSGGGKSGKNKEGYRYLLDGKERPNSQNSFSSLAYYATLGLFMTGEDVNSLEQKKDERLGSDQLKAVLKSKGINFGQDDTWELELPNGKKVGARRFTAEEQAAFDAEDATTDDNETEGGDTAAPETGEATGTPVSDPEAATV